MGAGQGNGGTERATSSRQTKSCGRGKDGKDGRGNGASREEREQSRRDKRRFKAVELARTPEDLDSLLNGVGPTVGKQILRKQIKQYTKVHGVSERLLPLSIKQGNQSKRKSLKFDEMYKNLRALLEAGDPLTLPQHAGTKRGRPRTSKGRKSATKRLKTDVDVEWTRD